LGVGFALLVAIGTATVWLAEQSAQDARSVVHTINVQEKLSNLLLNVRRAESGQRGFLLTGRQQYLLDYRDAAPAVETYLAELRTLMSDNPDRGPVLDQMDATARTKMTELAKTIELQASGQHEAAVALVQSDDGFKSMNGLRLLVERTLADEERLLLARSDASRRNDARLLAVSLAGMALVVLIGALSVFLVQRTSRQRESARSELAATNANLERIVAHRTADLTEANEEIQRFAYIVSHDLRSPLVNIMGFTTELEALRSDIFEEMAKLRERAGVAAAHADARESGGASTDPLARVSMKRSPSSSLHHQDGSSHQRRSEAHARAAATSSPKRSTFAAGVDHKPSRTAPRSRERPSPSPTFPRGKRPARSGAGVLQSRRQCSKYGRDGEPGRIEIKGHTARAHVMYEVRDNGRGIDPHDHQRVFELFRRSGPQDRPGEGIGLAHVRALVRRLGGTMSLTSELGKGSVFTVTLPRRWVGENRSAA
jgi:CHASE3 domain sensor protein